MIVAWDFDGVLNRSQREGRFLWAQRFEEDMGVDLASFVAAVFADRFEDILCGREDLQERVATWCAQSGCAFDADHVLDYWFARDAHPDAEMGVLLDMLGARGVRQIIATNNEPRRAAYIASTLGYGARVEEVCASGHMGAAKPDPAFFEGVVGLLGARHSDMMLIDDDAANIEAAEALGWGGFHFTAATRHRLAAQLAL